jgi:FkbM family methyltransferase
MGLQGRTTRQDEQMSFFLRLAGRVPADWIHAFGRFRGRAPWIKRATDWIPHAIRHSEGVIQRGVGRGLRFNAGGSAVGFLLGTHDPAIQAALNGLLKPGMVVYDVGANIGFTAMIAAHLVGPEGRIICFEPQASLHDLLRHNAAINGFERVEVRGEALAAENGSARFLVSPDSTFSRLADISGQPIAQEIDVPVRRLDSLRAEASLARPDLIKVDVEGAEAPMLEGAMETLREAKPLLLIELHGTNKLVADVLAKAGYTTRVVGTREAIEDAHWNSLAIGVPPNRADLDPVLEELSKPPQTAA